MPDAACLTSEEAENLKAYVKNGGNLIASFEAGFYDEQGQFTERLFDLFGLAEAEGTLPVYMGENYIRLNEDYGPWKRGTMLERGAYVLKVKAKPSVTIPMNFLNPLEKVYAPLTGDSIWPAMVLNDYGRGRVAYFPEALGHFFGQTGMVSAESRMVVTVKEFIGEPMVALNAPKTVAMEVFRQKDSQRWLIHLMNMGVDGRPVNEFLPVQNLTLKIKLDHQPKIVAALRENPSLKYSYKGHELYITELKLSEYEVIILE